MQEFLDKYRRFLYVLLAGLVLFVAYLLFVNVDDVLNNDAEDTKKVELENVVLSGYQKGALSWLLKARYAWSSYSLDHAIVEDIYDGKLYDDGRIILRDFSAKKVQVNAPQERLYADDGVKAVLLRQTDEEEHKVDVWAEQLQYFSQEKMSYVRKKVKIRDQDIEVEASSAEINHTDNTVKFGQDFVLTKPGSKITGYALLVKINTQSFAVSGNVELLKQAEKSSQDEFKKKDTKVNSDELFLQMVSGDAQARLAGNIKIWQEDKQGFADEAYYREQAEEVILSGNAGVVFDKSDWLLDAKTIEKLKNKEAKKSIYEKLILKGRVLNISTRTKDMQAQGKVYVSVKDKEATAEEAFYDSRAEDILLTGDVHLKKADGTWIQAAKVSVDINTEKFSAEGQAESTVILKR